MQITKLKLTDITVKERLRGVDSEKVERLKESILRSGLIHPITVSGGVLVAGLHRLTAFKELGYDEIDCHIIDDDELLKKEIEIDENLYRNELTVLEKGKMEAMKKSNEEEWMKRQLIIQYDTTYPVETRYELSKLESISVEAKENIKGSVLENDKTFLMGLAELSKDNQVSITRDLSEKIVTDVSRLVKRESIKEKYPDKDRNQIKFQTDDEHMEMAQKFIKMYRWRSVPDLVRKLFESYLNAFFREEKEPADDEILDMFDGLSGNISREEYQSVETGRHI
jgi:ParB-like chromosome segregation protein Spo0J